MRKLPPERKLRLLAEYMNLFINQWPNKIKPFDSWVDSTIDKKIKKSRHEWNEQQRRICKYCRREFIENLNDKTKDHIVPLSKGGLDKKENRVPCCFDCNHWKADKLLEVWHDEILKHVKRGKGIRGYELTRLGLMIGNIRMIMQYVKSNPTKVSIYKT